MMLSNELTGIAELAERLIDLTCDEDDFRHGVAIAMDAIAAAWEASVFSQASSESLTRYFSYHLEGIRKISDTLYLSESNPDRPVLLSEKGFFQARLLMLVDVMKRDFPQFFDETIAAPYAYHDYMINEQNEQYIRVEKHLKNENLPSSLRNMLTGYLSAMMTNSRNEHFSYTAHRYFQYVLSALDKSVISKGQEPLVETISHILSRFNFNHLAFFNFKIGEIHEATSQLSAVDKNKCLKRLFREARWQPVGQPAYDPLWPSLNHILSEWLNEQIALSEKLIHDHATPCVLPKIALNLSVAHLACLLRLFCEENVIHNSTLTDIFKFASFSYKTKRQENISASSLSKEFYSINQVTAAVVRDLLHKMILRINRNFFPVWAAVYVAIYVFLKIR